MKECAMNIEKIKEFYSNLHFPGRYSLEDLKFYEEQGIHNIYLREIDAVMHNGLDVLDVGCGTGLISNLFADKYKKSKFTAVDFSDSIDYASKFAKTNGINNVKWIKRDFLQFKTGKKYDVIICCGVLHHIPEYEKALAKIKQLLKPGGKLLLALYNPYGKVLKRFFTINYNCDTLYQDQENNPFELSFSSSEVRDMCSDLEFQSATPGISNRFVDFLAWFNSENGGLVLYIFNKRK
jgi:2-polyprenyl-3-methyl-5-hydroxy-6-metoxy-1,4-benzoquinol methylase